MTDIVQNGRRATLVIPRVHDGTCGVAVGEPLTVAFRPTVATATPERSRGALVSLDGEPYRLSSITRSQITAGFYLATLERAA